MQAIAVGGFHQQHVGLHAGRRIRQDRAAVAAQVAAEQHAPTAVAAPSRQHVRRPEQMARVDELHLDLLAYLDRLAERASLEPRQRLDRVGLRVERQRGGVFRVAVAVGVPRVFFLDARRVRQDQPGQVVRAAGAVDPALEAAGHQPRQPPRVVQVRMREDDGIDGVGRNGQGGPVAKPQLLEPLEQPAVEQRALSVDLEKVLGAGHGPGGSKKRQCGHPSNFTRQSVTYGPRRHGDTEKANS